MKKIVACMAVLLLGLFTPQHIFAHFSKTDGEMSVTLHVDPNDDPIPGQKANLYFLFDDVSQRFRLSTCSCTVSISQEGKQLYQQKLIEKKSAKPSIWGARLPYIFPQRDVYHITLTGDPVVANVFQPFFLSWDFRVDPDNSPGIVQEGFSDIQIIFALTIGGVVFFILFGWFVKKYILDGELVDSPTKNPYNTKRR